MKWQEAAENYTVRGFVMFTLYDTYWGRKIIEVMIGGTNIRDDNCTQHFNRIEPVYVCQLLDMLRFVYLTYIVRV